MSSGVGASGERCSSRVGNCRTEDAGRENNVDSPCLKAARPRVDSENPAGEGRSNSVEQQGRPAWPGRKSHKKTCIKDNKETHEDVAQNRQEEQRTRSLSSIQINRGLEVGQGSSNLSGGHPCPRPACSRTSINSLNSQSPQPASSASSRCSLQPRCTLLSPQGPSTRTADPDCSSCSSPSEPDLFWVNVRTEAAARQSSQSHQTQTHITTVTSSALGNEEEEEEDQAAGDGVEEGSGVLEVMSRTMALALVPPCSPVGERRTSKREKNRMRGLRRRQRRRERWRQSQQESRQSSTGNASSSSSEDEEDLSSRDRDGYSCAVCLDVYFNPYMCHPCNHIFCEPCLRTLAKNSPTNTPCPLCRTVITHVFFQKELNQTARTFFPKEYITRKQNFQKASCAKWPLPSCRKLFRIFGGFQRPSSPVARRQFRHGGGYRVDTLDFEDQSQGWRFDLDMIVIYIYSVNWVIGFFIFCFLCYLFFPSF